MPTPMYECMHVPVKTAWSVVKNPIPTSVAAAASIGIFLAYGIWPFLVVGGMIIAGMIAFMVLLNKKAAEEARATVQAKASDIPRSQNFLTSARCIRHQDRMATTVYRIPIPSGGIKMVSVCAPCVPEFESWLDQKQLTTRR